MLPSILAITFSQRLDHAGEVQPQCGGLHSIPFCKLDGLSGLGTFGSGGDVSLRVFNELVDANCISQFASTRDAVERFKSVISFIDTPIARKILRKEGDVVIGVSKPDEFSVGYAFSVLADSAELRENSIIRPVSVSNVVELRAKAMVYFKAAEATNLAGRTARNDTIVAFSMLEQSLLEKSPGKQLATLNKALACGPFDHESVTAAIELQRCAVLLRIGALKAFDNAWDIRNRAHPALARWGSFNKTCRARMLQLACIEMPELKRDLSGEDKVLLGFGAEK